MPIRDRVASREYFRDRMARAKSERLPMALARLGNKCVRCGSTKDLEFDHLNPANKIFNVCAGFTRTLEDFLREVDKCQLLCVECHKEKTNKEQGWIKTDVVKQLKKRGLFRSDIEQLVAHLI